MSVQRLGGALRSRVTRVGLLEHSDEAGALGDEDGLVPSRPPVFDTETSRLGHEVQFREPNASLRSRIVNRSVVDIPPAVRRGDLSQRIVARVDTDVVIVHDRDLGDR
jgi:hypothetical protein